MEVVSEKTCKSVFVHSGEEAISEAFTRLWSQVINKKENCQKQCIVQTDTPDYNK